MNKLPKVFVNKTSNKNVNNEQVFYSNDISGVNNVSKTLDSSNVVNNLLVQKKINDIFNSPNFVYKVKVNVVLKDEGEKVLTLISKTNDSVLTIDNKTILIKDILQISEK